MTPTIATAHQRLTAELEQAVASRSRPPVKDALTRGLINYLLDNKHLLWNTEIVDCLILARLNPDPTTRILPAELARHLGLNSPRYLSTRLRRLKRRGLIAYDIGIAFHPGYRITRVGPEA
jgi:hypothetical protein